ncbi:Ig-like domain-containing protein [Orbus sturtevantii]|uniref:Ig-like domain-containing protein n=1 Tax=Orbus sturtevantii TaxID=3074109 RepID=UPI00370D6E09
MRVISRILLTVQIVLPIFTSAQSIASAINLDAEALKNHEVLSKVKSSLPELTSKLASDGNKNVSGEELLASGLSRTAQIVLSDNSNDAAKGWLESSAYGYLSGQMQSWLNQYGNGRIQIGKRTFSAELLIPLFENSNHLIFSQSRINREDQNRKMANLGLGYRHFSDDWMWGVNSFYDRDLKNDNARLGAGLELGADYLRFSTNGYFRLTDWRESKLSDFADYDERPANGFDVRAEGYLPSYPNIGANLQYEKYFGENVNLKGSSSLSNLKDDPEAYRIGLSYTPVPLFSFKVDHAMGDVNETTGLFELNYRLGVPLDQQLDSNFVSEMRTLKGSRYNFVDRNNSIVMQYQKQALLRIALPKTLAIRATESATLTPTITQNKGKIDYVEWSAPSLIAKGGTLTASPFYPYIATITMPFYDSLSTLDGNNYDVTAVAVDIDGNRSNMATTRVIVSPAPIDEKISAFTISPDTDILADGKATAIVSVQLIDDIAAKPLANMAVDFAIMNDKRAYLDGFKLDGNEGTTLTQMTDSEGHITFPITSTTPGDYALSVSVDGRELGRASISFMTTAKISDEEIEIIGEPIANSDEGVTVKVKIVDEDGQPVIGEKVTFTEADGTVTIAETDFEGFAHIIILSPRPGNNDLLVRVGNSEKKVPIDFSADLGTAKIDSDALTVLTKDDKKRANGTDTHKVQVLVKDGRKNVVAGQKVTFSADNGATITQEVTTDENGLAVADVKSDTVGESTIVATMTNTKNNSSRAEAKVSFVQDNSTAHVDEGSITVTDGVAGGEGATVKVKVVDKNGDIIVGEDVSFTDENGKVTTVTTDKDGNAELVISSSKSGASKVTVNVGDSTQEIDINYVADSSTAHVDEGSITVTDGVAGGKGATVKVKVVDKNGNVVANQDVTFTDADGVVKTVKTDKDGNAELTVSNPKAGGSKVTVNVGDSTQEIDINYVADSSTAHVDEGSITVTDGVAGGEGATVKVKVVDKNGNVVANQDVTFTDADGVVKTVKTDKDGNAELTVSNPKAGGSKVTVNVGDSTQEIDINYVADSSTAHVDEGSITVTDGVAGGEGATVKVKVVDKNGNVVANQDVTFTDADGVIKTVKTDKDGNAELTVSNPKAGESKVTVNVGDSTQEIDINYVADSSTAHVDEGSITVTDGVAGGEGATVKVKVVDKNGNVVANQDVTFTDADGVVKTVKTDKDGNAELIVSNPKAGGSKVTVNVGDSTQEIDINYVADSSTAHVDEGSITVTDGVAGGKGATVKVKVVDKNGNVVANQDVTFTDADGVVKTVKTDKDGNAELTVSNPKAGGSKVTVNVGDATQEIDINYVADSSTAHVDEGSITVTDGVAGGKGATVKVKVVDKNGNVVANQDVTFTDADGVVKTVKTDKDGNATLVVTGNKPGSNAVTVKVGDSTQEIDINFVEDDSAHVDEGSITVTDGVAGGKGATVKVKVVDKNGNIIAGEDVSFTDENGKVTTVTTDKDGNAELVVSSSKSGASKVTVNVGDSTQEIDINFVADSSTAHVDEGSITVTDGVAGGKGATVKVKVVDKNGNVVANQDVTFTDADGVVKTVKTDKDGNAELTVSNPKAGESKVTVNVGDSTQEIDINYVADSSTAHVDEGSITVTDGVAGGKGATVKVKVVDKNGNVVANQDVTFTDADGVVKTVKTDKDGNAELTVSNPKAGGSKVTVNVGDSTQEIDINYVADSSTAHVDEGSITVTDGVAGGKGATVKVKVVDKNGNVVANQDVTFTDADGVVKTVKTDKDGNAELTVSNPKAGGSKVTVNVGDSTQEIDINYVADSSTAHVDEGSITVTDGVAGGKGATVKVKVVDKNGNVVANQDVTFTDADGVVKTVKTDKDGNAELTVSNPKAGGSKVTVNVGDSTQEIDINYVADSSTAHVDEGSITVTDGVAGGKGATVKVKVVDKNGNVVANQDVTFTDADGVVKTVKTDKDGNAELTVSNPKAGESKVTVNVGDSTQEIDINFVADKDTATLTKGDLIVLTENEEKLANGTDIHRVQVTVKDRLGNAVAEQKVTFSADNGATVTQEVITNENGIAIAEVTNKTGGDSEITASVTNTKNIVSSANVSVTFISNIPEVNTTKSSVALSTTRIVNNGATSSTTGGSSTVTVTLQDTSGNAISGIADSIMLTSDKAGLNMPTNKNDTANRLVFKETGTNTGIYTAAIKTAAVDNKSAVGDYQITLSFNNGITYTKQLTFTVYTYQLVMNYPSREIGPGMIYEYKVYAIDSDTGTVNTSIVPGTYTWSSSNASVVSVNSVGWVKGEKQSDNQITVKATPSNAKFNGISLGVATGLVSVTALDSSPIYGVTSKSDPSPDYLIAPPDYQLLARTGSIVDAIGETGGTLGDKKYITQTDKVTKIEVLICTYTVRTGLRKYEDVPAVGQLIFHYNSSSPIGKIEIGKGDCKDKKAVQTFTIPENQQFVGYRAWTTELMKVYGGVETRYIAGVQLYSAKK